MSPLHPTFQIHPISMHAAPPVYILLACCPASICSLDNTFSCDISPLSFLSYLLSLSGVYWCNNWCLHSPSPSSFFFSSSSAPFAPHTTNKLASRLKNQLSRREEGKSNLTAAN